MKKLLTATALIEAGAGLPLLTLPSLAATLVFGPSLDTAEGVTVMRVAGAALVTIGLACWLARHDERSRAARGLVGAMVFYNAAVLAVLLHAGANLGLPGGVIWPAALVHAAMGAWCVAVLLKNRA